MRVTLVLAVLLALLFPVRQLTGGPTIPPAEFQRQVAATYCTVVVLVALLHFMRSQPAVIDGSTIYGDRMPFSVVRQTQDQGQFRSSDIREAVVERLPAPYNNRVRVMLGGPEGRRATFTGLAKEGLEVHLRDAPENERARQVVREFDGGTALAVRVARDAGAPVHGDTDAVE